MNWQTMHHLYIGSGMGFVGLAWLIIALPLRDLRSITWSLIVVIGGFTYALDDAFQHWLGWNTPFHRLDVFLKKFWLYQRICDWLDRRFFKK